jgi:MFS family permease
MAAVADQVPAGMLVDALSHKRLITAVGIAAVIASALVLGIFPDRWPVLAAELLQDASACLLTPAIAAMSLILSEKREIRLTPRGHCAI